MRNVTNPIIIDQNYCDSARTTTPSSCHEQVYISIPSSYIYSTSVQVFSAAASSIVRSSRVTLVRMHARTHTFHAQGSAVAVRNISYRNIHGTSASRVAISLVCSAALRCDGIRMQDVYLVGEGRYATCSYRNATVVQSGYTFPFCSAEM